MASNLDIKLVVKHIINGTLVENLCRICLLPLDESCENIFTKICKADKDYCVAEVLEEICNIKICHNEKYNVCSDCFLTVSAAYKFYLTSQRSTEILEFYIDQIKKNIDMVLVPSKALDESLCISLPMVTTNIQSYDYDLNGISTKIYNYEPDDISVNTYESCNFQENNKEWELKTKMLKSEKNPIDSEDEDVVIVIQENGEKKVYKVLINGKIEPFNEQSKDVPRAITLNVRSDLMKKKRRKRDPMVYQSCSRCPIKYRFIAKLKEHMKTEHNIDLFLCKICKTTMEDAKEFQDHLKMHANTHTCDICNAVFKRHETLIAHMKRHEKIENVTYMEGSHICEICGLVLSNEDHLKDHYSKKHDKKYTCYYCGRMYKGEISFEMHIKKHEAHTTAREEHKDPAKSERSTPRRYECSMCSRHFVDERALMWHRRLHTNERPYVCDVCGRKFVSANRRNQHALCAHTAPSRRCPLCPALFHLRSMVNTHIRKVHLKTHKRRHRTTKYREVYWRTKPVPIEELSISIQNDLLELKTKNDGDFDTESYSNKKHRPQIDRF